MYHVNACVQRVRAHYLTKTTHHHHRLRHTPSCTPSCSAQSAVTRHPDTRVQLYTQLLHCTSTDQTTRRKILSVRMFGQARVDRGGRDERLLLVGGTGGRGALVLAGKDWASSWHGFSLVTSRTCPQAKPRSASGGRRRARAPKITPCTAAESCARRTGAREQLSAANLTAAASRPRRPPSGVEQVARRRGPHGQSAATGGRSRAPRNQCSVVTCNNCPKNGWFRVA